MYIETKTNSQEENDMKNTLLIASKVLAIASMVVNIGIAIANKRK